MNDKLKRVVAIIALVLVLVFTVSLIMYLFDRSLLNGAVGDLALWSGAFGGLLALVLWLSHAFPAQQRKDEERDKIYKEAEEMDKQAEKADSVKGDSSVKEHSEVMPQGDSLDEKTPNSVSTETSQNEGGVDNY